MNTDKANCNQKIIDSSAPKTRLIPATDWDKCHPWPPIGGLRHLIFNAETNGFNKVVRRIGRRVLIDEDAFFEWINAEGAK